MADFSFKTFVEGFTNAPLVNILATLGDLAWLVALVGAAVFFYRRRQAQRRRHARRTGYGEYVIGIQVGVPMAQGIASFYGRAADVIVDAKAVCGKEKIDFSADSVDLYKIWREVWKYVAPNSDKNIHLFLSGPVAMAFRFGQLLPDHKFGGIEVYHFDASQKAYVQVANPDRSWLEQ